MCGIAGIIHCDPHDLVREKRLGEMLDSLSHRGPDDSGSYLKNGAAMGSRRLAVLDLSTHGHMPMSTADGRYTIVYNGEVYNYRELRNELENKGYVFHSDSDTEVVLNGYVEEGPNILQKLDGMFSIAIWDAEKRKLFLARDHIGIKPLYYSQDETAIYFASEQKALFVAGIPFQVDSQTWKELLCFGYVAGERTPFEGVKRLLAGHYLIWQQGTIQIYQWWNLSQRAQARRSQIPRDPYAWFRETFDKSVVRRNISDVPVGVLLSGGLDSTSISASLATQIKSRIASFTVSFTEKGYDESPIAKKVAKKWGLEYHDLRVESKDILSKLRQASWLNDEPLLHASTVHLLAVSEFAKPRVTVLLSGEGSDEILGGYDRHLILNSARLLKIARFLPHWLVRVSHRLHKLKKFSMLPDQDRIAFYNSCEILPDELNSIGFHSRDEMVFREKIFQESKELYPGDLFRQSMYYDQHTFLGSILDRNDRMTMGASIECRVPFLDSQLMEVAAALPTKILFGNGLGKHLLRKAIGHRLPKEVLRHKKWGFGVPWVQYLRSEPDLRSRLIQAPDLEPLDSQMPVDQAKVRQVINEFLDGSSHHEKLVQRLFMISIWYETYVLKLKNNVHSPIAEHVVHVARNCLAV